MMNIHVSFFFISPFFGENVRDGRETADGDFPLKGWVPDESPPHKKRAKRRHLELFVQIHCLFLQLSARRSIFLTWYLHSQPPRGRNTTNAAERSGSFEVNPVKSILITTAGLNQTGCVSPAQLLHGTQIKRSVQMLVFPSNLKFLVLFVFFWGGGGLVVAVAIKVRKNESQEGRVTKKS